MHIEKVSNNGIPYIRVVQSYYGKTVAGKYTCKKKIIKTIGPLHRFDDGKDNFWERLKISFRNNNPLINELKEFCENKPNFKTHTIKFTDYSPNSVATTKSMANMITDKIMDDLNIGYFVSHIKSRLKINYDVLNFIRLLVAGRLLKPASKIATVRQNEDYFTPFIDGDFYEYNVYDTLDFINDVRVPLLKRINKALTNNNTNDTNLLFYDVTNFYFEIENPDADTLDEDGNVLEKGIRKKGVSKEERSNPIVQVGLFMNSDGLPVSLELFPGNTLDAQTFIPACKSTIDNMNLKRFILVADRGLYTSNNMFHINKVGNNGYIVSKSIKKSNKKDQEWITDSSDYIQLNKDFKYKERVVNVKVNDTDESEHTIAQKQVVYWSKKFHDKELAENKSFLEFLEKLNENPRGFISSKFSKKTLSKFLKKEAFNEKTGEIIETKDIKNFIDQDKVKEFKNLMGYYLIASSELDMPALEIIDKYHNLTRIENEFRILKSTLNTRPMFVRKKEHICAHITICFIALLILNLIQKKVLKYAKENNINLSLKKEKIIKNKWEIGMSDDRIQDALNKFQIESLDDQLFRFVNINDKDLDIILKALDLNIEHKIYTRMEILKLKKHISSFN